ncbi:MAG: tol-pal system protein YbgF [Desulfovibrio sp.]
MKQSAIALIVLLIVGLTTLSGCATKSQVETLEMQARRDREESRKVYKQMEEELQSRIDQTNTPVREKQADIWVELNALRADMAALQGQVDDLNVRMDQLAGSGDASSSLPALALDMKAVKFALEHQMAIDLEKIRQQLAPQGTAPTAAAANAAGIASGTAGLTPEQKAEQAITQADQTPGAPAAPDQTTAESTAAAQANALDPAQALYDKAYAAFGERKYADARRLWAEFVTAFPEHFLVSNAVFWQGECYYQLEDYKRAVLAYQDVIKKFPKSSKYKYSLLKQGISFYKMGREDLGKVVLQDLIDKYPSTPEAARAKQYIQGG